MPTYDYQCDACGNKFEQYQPITAKPIKKCPKCGKNKVRRLIGTGAGLIFKGSGFYITDYRSEGYKNSAKADSAPTGDKSAATSEKKAASPDKTTVKADPAPAKKESKPPSKDKSK